MILSELSPLNLLQLTGKILEELQERKIISTSNAPLGDYAEWLYRESYGWNAAGNSAKDYDAIDTKNIKYRIKARRVHSRNKSRQLGALRRLDEGNFDVLVAVLFNDDFTVMRAALIPHAVVVKEAKWVKATNSWRFILRDSVWDYDEVRDCTSILGQIQEQS
jgi:hypothetical protein